MPRVVKSNQLTSCAQVSDGLKMKGLGETYTDTGDGDSLHKGPGTFLLWVGGALLITAPPLAMIRSADVDSVPGSDCLVGPGCNSARLGILILAQIVPYQKV